MPCMQTETLHTAFTLADLSQETAYCICANILASECACTVWRADTDLIFGI